MTNVRRCPELDDLAAWCVRDKQASPCAVVACAYRSADGWRVDEGAAGHLAPGQEEASVDTIFDLASLTKPFSALTFARLVRAGLLDWHMPLGVPLRDAHGTPSDKVPLAWFVAHRSGLDGHRPLYAPLERGGEVDRLQALRQAGLARRPECEESLPQAEGFAPMYSDLGYLLFGEAMARASGVVLDDLIRQEVSEPLGLVVGSARQWRRWDPSFDERVAPTEHVAWRGGVIRGAVHDENAWAMAEDGACAHAGLFGAARDVARLGTAVLDACRGDRSDWLSPEDVEPLIRVRPGSTLRAGFDGKSSNGSSTAGKRCSPHTFGHLGFTGTSVWIDPDAEVVVVLLTNRVYPTRDSTAIQEVRPRANDELFAWGMGKGQGY
jgi:CubicO group peptidase (beta-lactamase class C family)